MRTITLVAVLAVLASAAFAQQSPGTTGDTIRASSTAARSAANFRTLVNDAACTSRFHAWAKPTGAQRLHRGIWAPRSGNPILQRSITGDICRNRPSRCWT